MVELVGTCYEDAWRYLIKEEEGSLIHGSLQLSAEGRRVKHAWVELPTGFIWEPQTKSYYTVKDFQIMSPLEEQRYTDEEAAIMAARTGKHGPWTKEEREQFLKRGNPGIEYWRDFTELSKSDQGKIETSIRPKPYTDHLWQTDDKGRLLLNQEGRPLMSKHKYPAAYQKRLLEGGNPIPEEVPAVPEVTNFMEEWEVVAPELEVVATFSVDPRTNTVDINTFYVTSEVKGIGSLAMRKMVDLADKYGVTLRGLPIPKKTQFREAMTKDQLISFYERFGFKVETVNGVETIVREPTIKPPAVEVAIEHRGTEPEGIAIADEIGVAYDGIQPELGMQFTDVRQTGSTFYANTLEEATIELADMRAKFARPLAAEVPTMPEAERLETYHTETAQQIADDYLQRAKGVVETDVYFRRDNPDMTIRDYALDLIDDDMEYARLTGQVEWRRDLRKIRKLIKTKKDKSLDIPIKEAELLAKPPAVPPPAVPEVERAARIKYFRGEEAKWRETAYKIAEKERGEAPFAEAIRKADEFGRQAAELEAKPLAVEEVKEGNNPMGKVINKEEAIGLLERLSMTPGEAARSLVAEEAERREIMQTVQQRVKREQNKWAPMDPREGPPLPRIFAGLRWPWKK